MDKSCSATMDLYGKNYASPPRPWSYFWLVLLLASPKCLCYPERARVLEAARNAVAYLVRICTSDGRFVYKVDLDSGLSVENVGYNVTRHAGVVYALALHLRRSGDTDPTVRDALQRATMWLRGATEQVPDRPDLLAIRTVHPLRDPSGKFEATLGATALGLLAFLAVADVIPETTPEDVFVKLGNFLLFLQYPDGSFADRFVAETASLSRGTSLYYPGEAILALLTLYEKDRSPHWLDSATMGIAWLLPTRAESAEASEPDHWALLAAAKWLRHGSRAPSLISPAQVIECAKRICNCILSRAPCYPAGSMLHGCLTSDGRTCPTATRLEGLLAAYSFLPPTEEVLRARIRDTCASATAFLLRAQVQTGPWAGALPMTLRRPADTHPLSSEKFSSRAREVRMDYVQHALCAFLNFAELMGEDFVEGEKP